MPTAEQLNRLVDGLITAGKYKEALAAPRVYAGDDELAEVLVQINLAEAEYNLGRWDAAWDRLRPLEAIASQYPIARAGLSQQRAWIAAHQSRAAEALALWRETDVRGFPRQYRAEYHFTHAVVLLGVGLVGQADEAAAAGTDAAVRPSSRRNALFIEARVAVAQGDRDGADSLCHSAAAQHYRGQGGDGLLLWGDVLVQLRRVEEARAAWSLAIERDPQSESSKLAAARLNTLAAPSRPGS